MEPEMADTVERSAPQHAVASSTATAQAIAADNIQLTLAAASTLLWPHRCSARLRQEIRAFHKRRYADGWVAYTPNLAIPVAKPSFRTRLKGKLFVHGSYRALLSKR